MSMISGRMFLPLSGCTGCRSILLQNAAFVASPYALVAFIFIRAYFCHAPFSQILLKSSALTRHSLYVSLVRCFDVYRQFIKRLTPNICWSLFAFCLCVCSMYGVVYVCVCVCVCVTALIATKGWRCFRHRHTSSLIWLQQLSLCEGMRMCAPT